MTYADFFTPAQPPSVKEAWRDQAACRKITDKDEFYSAAWIDETDYSRPEAERICKEECPVRNECAAYAASPHSNAYGVYAGFFFMGGSLRSQEARRLFEATGVRASTRQRPRRPAVTNNGSAS